MKKLFVVMAVLVILGLSIPASAQWTFNWSENFDGYVGNSDLGGQGGWLKNPTASNSGKVVDNKAGALSNDHYYQQVASTKSASNKDLRGLNPWNSTYKEGKVKAWVWDPRAGTTPTTDTRVGVFSSVVGLGDNIGKLFTANITSGTGLTGDYNYWRAQWSYSALSMDGAATAAGPGYTFTAGAAAPRIAGWSNVIIHWVFDYSVGTCHVDWYVNLDMEDPQVNLMLDFNSTSGRWANAKDIAGVYVGSLGVSSTFPGRIDDLEFSGDPKIVPEPTGLIALGTGMFGLLGLIRRRK